MYIHINKRTPQLPSQQDKLRTKGKQSEEIQETLTTFPQTQHPVLLLLQSISTHVCPRRGNEHRKSGEGMVRDLSQQNQLDDNGGQFHWLLLCRVPWYKVRH
jgi:hypothetical protein